MVMWKNVLFYTAPIHFLTAVISAKCNNEIIAQYKPDCQKHLIELASASERQEFPFPRNTYRLIDTLMHCGESII